ncbi:MAG: ROK family transcriptional regulator [Spirochaetaceae bacterium]|nr:MAG: ROK family transcriptional regulator [Spirochaetaceae bacterium]
MTELNRHRYENAVRVLEALWRNPAMSRADLARNLRLDRSTTGSIIDFFLNAALVSETHADPKAVYSRQGGRPPLLVELKTDRFHSIGVELKPNSATVLVTDLGGNVVCEKAFRLGPRIETRAVDLAKHMRELYRDMVSASYATPIHGITSIGIGVSGIVSPDAQSIEFSRELGIRTSVPFGTLLQEHMDVPVWLFADADACALAELEYGNRRVDDLLFVLAKLDPPTFRAGLGIVLDRNLRTSHSGVGREFRSPFVSPESSEQFAVADDFSAGSVDPSAARIQYSDELAVSIAFLVHALDLRNVVLGGDLGGEEFELVSERIGQHVRTDTVRADHQPLELWPSSNTHSAVALGASAGALRELFFTHRFPIPGIATRDTVRQA